MKDLFCSYCGAKHIDINYPKVCSCKNITYNNPLPVIAVLYKSYIFNDVNGILIVKRSINPNKGGWALPGGYIDYGESFQEAASRELFEETGIITKPNDFKLFDINKSINNNLIIFASYEGKLQHYSLINFVENSETEAIKFICNPSEEICFATHKAAIEKYL